MRENLPGAEIIPDVESLQSLQRPVFRVNRQSAMTVSGERDAVFGNTPGNCFQNGIRGFLRFIRREIEHPARAAELNRRIQVSRAVRRSEMLNRNSPLDRFHKHTERAAQRSEMDMKETPLAGQAASEPDFGDEPHQLFHRHKGSACIGHGNFDPKALGDCVEIQLHGAGKRGRRIGVV